MPDFSFRLLGRLTVACEGVEGSLGGPKQRAMFAALLLTPNRVVALGRLAGLVWENPPRSATANLRTYATGLRKVLGARLLGTSGGYELDVRAGESDLEAFHEAVRRARVGRAAGDLVTARDEYAAALALWSGPSGEGLSEDSPVRALLCALAESRVLALEESVAARLDLGEDDALVGELRAALAEYPTRERLWAQLMIALYRCGDVSGALGAYRHAMIVLDRALGMRPGQELCSLQAAILDRDPVLGQRLRGLPAATAPLADAPVPHQLPIDTRVLVGRRPEIKQIVTAVQQRDGDAEVPTVVAITGTGGIGKSALAIHVAHQLASAHPDGQLYLDLQGACGGLEPISPAEALAILLRALDAAASASGDLVVDAARWRTAAAGRRLLVVLDNATDSEQVAPLLPASPGCTVIVTSRRAVATVEVALRLHLEVLSADNAAELLQRTCDVAGEPDATAELVRLCGGLPLALRIVAARLTNRPDWTAADMARRLADDRRRLDQLGVDDLDVRASFAVSYRELTAAVGAEERQAASVFRLMGILEVPVWDDDLLAALVGCSVRDAEIAVGRLIELHLVVASDGLYRMHDLMRLFARERAAAEVDFATREAARHRAFWYLAHAARTASSRLRPVPWETDPGPAPTDVQLRCPDRYAARAWFATRRATLFAALRCAEGEFPDTAMALGEALTCELELHARWNDIAEVNRTILALARRTGDRRAEAHALRVIATIRQRLDDPEGAMRNIEASITLYRDLRDDRGLAMSLHAEGIFRTEALDYELAHERLTTALRLIEPFEEPAWTGTVLNGLGMHHRERGHFDEAMRYLRRALALRRTCGDALGEMYTLMQLARADAALGATEAALAALAEVVSLAAEIDADDFELQARRLRFVVLRTAQRRNEAEAELRRAERVCQRVPDRLADHKLHELARYVEAANRTRGPAELFSQRAPA